jgi:hypothetical protein
MVKNSRYMSRTGKLTCDEVEFFGFITDIRNLEQFIPQGSIKNWDATIDSCSFGVPLISTVKVRITEMIPFSIVNFSGDALQKNDFNLNVQIKNNETMLAEVKLILTANLNPVLKKMVSVHIEKLLETLISEMEKFDKWTETFIRNQPL